MFLLFAFDLLLRRKARKVVFYVRDWPGLRSLTSQEIAGCTDTDGDVRQKKNDVLALESIPLVKEELSIVNHS